MHIRRLPFVTSLVKRATRVRLSRVELSRFDFRRRERELNRGFGQDCHGVQTRARERRLGLGFRDVALDPYP